MKSREILEKIVQEGGSCSWVEGCGGNLICSACPMSKLKRREDGNYYSCIESLRADELTPEQQDSKYRDAATRLLLDMSIEDLLRS